MAANAGKAFEADWQRSVEKTPGVLGIRLRDAGGVHLCPPGIQRMVATSCPSLRFTVRNPCDFLLFASPHLWALELKSTAAASWSFSSLRENQRTELLRWSNVPMVRAGVIVNYRRTGDTYFIPIQSLDRYMKTSGRKSLPAVAASAMGICIPATKKVSRWSYAVGTLWGLSSGSQCADGGK